ncbi:Uncharacterised protein [Enterobacter cloacae]|nr:Uncharacterised protein [Enterobacter cloacae]
MSLFQLRRQCRKYGSVGKCCGFSKGSLHHINGRENNVVVVQPGEHLFSKNQAFVGPHGMRI